MAQRDEAAFMFRQLQKQLVSHRVEGPFICRSRVQAQPNSAPLFPIMRRASLADRYGLFSRKLKRDSAVAQKEARARPGASQ
jgi:hypothetical protein